MRLYVSICLALILVFSSQLASAHDASYGYSQIQVKSDQVDAMIAIDQKSIIELGEIDSDGDGSLTKGEMDAGYEAVVDPYFKDKLYITVGENRIQYQLQRIEVPDFTVVQFYFTFPSEQPLYDVKLHYHLFYELSNDNHKNVSTIYVGDDEPVEYIFGAEQRVWEGGVTPGFWQNLLQFIVLGTEHILIGYDHILFLLALVVVGLPIRQVVFIITSFTVAHSITLIMASLNVVSLPGLWVEAVIALSIIYVAVENIVRKREVPYRWLITFVFGLIHGFGFANVLREIMIPPQHIVSSLLAFNVGVELGQLLLFAFILPLLWLLKKYGAIRKGNVVISGIIGIFGLIWFIERVGNINILGI